MNYNAKKYIFPAALATFFFTTQSFASEEVSWRFVSFLDANSSIGEASEWWMEEITERSEGRIVFKPYYGATLMPPSEIYPAIQDGRIQVGWGVHSYSGRPFPLTRVSEIPFQTKNPLAVTWALNNIYSSTEELREEWEGKGLYPLSFIGSPPNVVGSNSKIKSWEDYEGMRIRSLDYVAMAQDLVGANVVALPASDIYEGLQRGLIDGYSAFRFDLVGSMRLTEQAPYVADDGSGVYGNTELVINHNLWESLSEELRGVVTEVTNELPGRIEEIYNNYDISACEVVKSTDAKIYKLSEDSLDKYQSLVEDKIVSDWKSSVENDQLADNYFENYKRLLDEGESKNPNYISGVERCISQT